MSIPLEDNVSDILGKAQRGLGISDGQLAARSGVTVEKIHQIRTGDFDDDAVSRAAPILKLNAAALRKLATGEWLPERVEEIARMLSGAAITEEARAAARRLLLEAASPPKKLRKRA